MNSITCCQFSNSVVSQRPMIARIVNSITCCRYSNSVVSQWPIIARIGRLLHWATERSCCKSSKGHLSTGVAVSWTHRQLPNSGETQNICLKSGSWTTVKGCFDVTTQRRIFFSRRCWVVIFSFLVSSLPRGPRRICCFPIALGTSLLVDIGTADVSIHNPPFPSAFHNPLTLDRCDLKIRPYPLGSQCRPSTC